MAESEDVLKNRRVPKIILGIVLVLIAAVVAGMYLSPLNAGEGGVIMGNLSITSSAFENGGAIPELHSQKGGNMSPPLSIEGIDPKAKTIAMIVDDPDIPIPFLSFTHWVVYNIPADTAQIPQNVAPGEVISGLGGAMQGRNGFGRLAYVGPNPPFGTHVYRFKVYALDVVLDLKPGATRRQVQKAMDGHILQSGLLEGKFGV
jgi:Raf kinase inhibitor-like YbhB/YbcL family protein